MASWYSLLNFKAYNKHTGGWYPYQLRNSPPCPAVKGTFLNNTFNIQTSAVTSVEVLISPQMVNLQKPVIININGRQVFADKVKADKDFMINGFKNSFDREAIWINSVKLKVE